MSALVRRTVTLAGHRTSVALEPVFWEEIEAAASRHGCTVGALIAEIDTRRSASLASALRVHVVEALRARRQHI